MRFGGAFSAVFRRVTAFISRRSGFYPHSRTFNLQTDFRGRDGVPASQADSLGNLQTSLNSCREVTIQAYKWRGIGQAIAAESA